MEEYEMKPYLQPNVEICMAYINGPTQYRKVKYMALTALSSIIIAAERNILPFQQSLLQSFFSTIERCTEMQDQQIKGKTLMCAGNLANASGHEHFPQEALEKFTAFGLECLQQSESKFELKETAINYFSEIAKILKSKMAPIIPLIIEHILSSTETQICGEEVDKKGDQGAEFDLDSDDDDDGDDMIMQYDLEGVDEQVSAIHCLGNLSLYCSELMQPYMTRIWEKLQNLGGYVHENVRYHICLTFTQMAFG